MWWKNKYHTHIYKNKMEHISGPIIWHFIHLILLYAQVDDYRNIFKLRYWPLVFTSCKETFKKNLKRGLELVWLPHFRYGFWRKIFLLLCSINWPIISFLRLHFEILGNTCIVIICFPVDDIVNFDVNLSFIIKSFSRMIKNERSFEDQIKNICIIFK